MADSPVLAELQTLVDRREVKWHFSKRKLGLAGAQAIAEALSQAPAVRELLLDGCDIGTEGARAIANVLGTNTTLERLDVSSNGIQNDGARAMAQALETNRTLWWINVGQNDITADGARALFHAVEGNPTLRHLCLQKNHIAKDGARALAAALLMNSTLQHVNVQSNSIGDDGAKFVAEALKQNTATTYINLKGNGIRESGVRSLANALEGNVTLQELKLDGNKVQDVTLFGTISTLLQRNRARQGTQSALEGASPREVQQVRMDDVTGEDGEVRLPLKDLFQKCGEVLPVAEALQPVADQIPNLQQLLQFVGDKARQLKQRDSTQGLAVNLISYLLFYTAELHPKEESVYYRLCQALREKQRDLVQPWVPFVWGLLQAMKRLPPTPRRLLFRGCKDVWEKFRPTYLVGEEVTWYAFSSCSATLTAQKQFTGTTGDRVMFLLEMSSDVGRDIHQLSWYPTEEEVLLPPNVRFKVLDVVTDLAPGLTMVHMVETGMKDVLVAF